MLTITVVTTLRLEGELARPWVDEAAQAWFEIIAAMPAKSVTVDMSGVRSIDENGKNLLRQMLQRGSQLRDGRLMTEYMINRLMREAPEAKGFEKQEVIGKRSALKAPSASASADKDESPLPVQAQIKALEKGRGSNHAKSYGR